MMFSLSALVVGVFAWFTSSFVHNSEVEEFTVTPMGDCQVAGIKLYKFIYPHSTVVDDYDYLKPENGSVGKYNYNNEENSFGYLDNETWVKVEEMNLYDPIELIVKANSTLRSMNCNAVYEITLRSNSFSSGAVQVDAIHNSEKTKTDEQIFLSTVCDFDIFTSEDVDDENEEFLDTSTGQYTKYYPTFKSSNFSDEEKLYHKISYLAAKKNSHAHFFGTEPIPTSVEIGNKEVSADENGDITFYINVNYNPDQLSHFAKEISINHIRAVYDFSFEVTLLEGAGS